ncbi:MAG TPA: hypothetical protein VNZ64_24065 [Candidatus Acidoferrum sp.]|jgi:hypothetical protein|nr:hypothetical protein [Candidatus Acidoferrum sp.]
MNALKIEAKTQAVGLLCRGNSIRSIERIIGIDRDTVMRLKVRAGEVCAKIRDDTIRRLPQWPLLDRTLTALAGPAVPLLGFAQ